MNGNNLVLDQMVSITKSQLANNEMLHNMSTTECAVCLEENKVSKCEHIDKNQKPIDEFISTEHSTKTSSSFACSVINMTGMLIGLGQLSTPYALANGGWVSIFLLIGLGVICAYSACLLGKCLEKDHKSRSYIDIGQQAFGTKGKIIATIFVYTEVFMSLVSYTISLHDNLNEVFTGIKFKVPAIHLPESHLLTILAVIIALPSLWLGNLSSISFMSTGGILMSLTVFLTVASTAIFETGTKIQNIPALHLNKIPHISGLYVFSYAGHVVFPNIYKDMKDPSKYTKVAIVSFTTVMLLYTTLAFMGVKAFGTSVNSQVTLSMPQHLITTKIALWATVLTPMTKYALQFAPFAIKLEQSLSSFESSRIRMTIRSCIGSIFLLVILAFALTVPYFQYILSLTGSLVSVTLCIILPYIFHTKICLRELSKPLLFLNVMIIGIGATLSISGDISSSKSLIEIINKAPHK